jgi:hypothetical protein
MYRDGTPRVGVLAPHAYVGFWSSPERGWWHIGKCAPLTLPLIFIEHANGLSQRRLISTLVQLGSNPYEP